MIEHTATTCQARRKTNDGCQFLQVQVFAVLGAANEVCPGQALGLLCGAHRGSNSHYGSTLRGFAKFRQRGNDRTSPMQFADLLDGGRVVEEGGQLAEGEIAY
ncbi:MAG: hypothetical protein DI587_17485 [Variovorax paradoxus]|nr:MAG: hypothetical protein DI583_17485 [Variovorax paradoxus]PZQ08488.1 MAG: hypothetical protein DI587_17485 [Variovorax paradoxus]